MPLNIQATSLAIDVIVGVGTILFILSAATMVIVNWISQTFNWRGKFLDKSIRNIINSDQLTDRFYEHPFIRILFLPSKKVGAYQLPSYIPSHLFADALFDVLMNVGEGGGTNSIEKISVTRIQRSIETAKSQNPALGKMLDQVFQGLYQKRESVESKISVAKSNLELLFTEAMRQTSIWYRESVQRSALVIAIILACLANIDAIWISSQLWQAPTVQAVLVPAITAAPTQIPSGIESPFQQFFTLQDFQNSLVMPFGWSTVRPLDPLIRCGWIPGGPAQPGIWRVLASGLSECDVFVNLPAMDDLWGWSSKLAGILISAIAASQGASFCFDLLQRIFGSRRKEETARN